MAGVKGIFFLALAVAAAIADPLPYNPLSAEAIRDGMLRRVAADAQHKRAAVKAAQGPPLEQARLRRGASRVHSEGKRRRITVQNNATMCTNFWTELDAKWTAMTSIAACSNSSTAELIDVGTNAALFCDVSTTAVSTASRCGNDSMAAIAIPLYRKYKGYITSDCAAPSGVHADLAGERGDGMLGWFAGVSVQCVRDADNNFCTPLTSLVDDVEPRQVDGTFRSVTRELAELDISEGLAAADAWTSACTGGCGVVGSDALAAMEDDLSSLFSMWDNRSVAFHFALRWAANHGPCVERFVNGLPLCAQPTFTQQNPYDPFALLDCPGGPMQCGGELRSGLSDICDNVCDRQRLDRWSTEAFSQPLSPFLCARTGSGESCFLRHQMMLQELNVSMGMNSGPMIPYDLLEMKCKSEIDAQDSSETCSADCKLTLEQMNGKLECCADPIFEGMTAMQKLNVFYVANKCGVSMYPPCRQKYHTVDFAFTVNGVSPSWIDANMEDVGDLLTRDLSRQMGLSYTMLGVVNYQPGIAKFTLRALFDDDFGLDEEMDEGMDAVLRAAGFRDALSIKTNFKLPILSNKIPAIATLGTSTTVFGGTVSEVSVAEAELEDKNKQVIAMMKIDSLTVSTLNANNQATRRKIRLALARVARVAPYKVQISGATDSSGLMINASVLTSSIAKAPRAMRALSNKKLVDAALTRQEVATTSQVMFAMIVPAPRPPKLLDFCEMRPVYMSVPGELQYTFAIVHCHTVEDLYLKATFDSSLPLVRSHVSRRQLHEILNASTMLDSAQVLSRNFAAVELRPNGGGTQTIPQYLRELSGNLKMTCGGITLFQGIAHDAPSNFLYTLAPVRNPIEELWQSSFGAYKWPQPLMEDTISFAFMLGGPGATVDFPMAEFCVNHGLLKVVVDQQPAGAWKFTNDNGDLNFDGTEVRVRWRVPPCDISKFQTFADTRIPELMQLLRASASHRESSNAMMTFETIINHETWVGCKQRVDDLYDTDEVLQEIEGIRACADYTNIHDPCCNETLRWSDCCVPGTKVVSIPGVFDKVNQLAVTENCGANSDVVTALLEEEFADVLIATQVPEFGCDAAASGINDPRFWNRLTKPVWDCMRAVLDGRTKQGKETCSGDAQCWTHACNSEAGSTKRCARAQGGEAAAPLMRCMRENAAEELWDQLAFDLNVDPAQVSTNIPESQIPTAVWNAAVTAMRSRITVPSCSGPRTNMWCVVEGVTEAECSRHSTRDAGNRRLTWIPDPDGGGYCKMADLYQWNDYGWGDPETDEIGRQMCEAAFSSPGFSCTVYGHDSSYSTPSGCTSAGGQVLNTTGKTTKVYRLMTTEKSDWDEDGNEIFVQVPGDPYFCELETACNWDVDGSYTQGDIKKCLTAQNLTSGGQSVTLANAMLTENGKKMTCLQCWGAWCHPFYSSTAHVCAAAPWHDDLCAAETGGGPDNLTSVSARTGYYIGEAEHFKCRRDHFPNETACLDQRVCPVPAHTEWQSSNDPYIYNCAENMCINMTADETFCMGDMYGGQKISSTLTLYSGWRPLWRGGNGLCQLYGTWDETKWWDGWTDLNSKTQCEAFGATWWEGRVFRPGSFNNAETCVEYCDDGEWPPKPQCEEGTSQCDMSCAQCLPSDSDKEIGVCVYSGAVSENECSQNQTDGYTWDWNSHMCIWRDNTGIEAECEARGPLHSFYTCLGQEYDGCLSYCMSLDHLDETSCWMYGLEWDWEEQICKHYNWNADRAFSEACTSLNTSDACYAVKGCWWDGSKCDGISTGCNQMAGNNTWVGYTDLGAPAMNGYLHCRWDEWARCSDEGSCLAAGECDDWWAWGGACVVPRQANQYGWVQDCWELGYEWAGSAWCVATRTKAFCNQEMYPGSKWVWPAETQAECDAHGDICRDPFDEWDVRGGMSQDPDTCEDKCELVHTKANHFRSGKWTETGHVPLYWVERNITGINTWEEQSISPNRFNNFVMRGMSAVVATVLETQVLCKLDSMTSWVPVFAGLCGEEGGGIDEGKTEVVYSLAKGTLACGKLSKAKPKVTFHGSYTPGAQSSCAAGRRNGANSAVVSLEKVVPVDSTTRRLLLSKDRRALTACTAHRVIKNAAGAIIGQKVGSGLKVSGISNVQICVNPSVTQRCSEYTVKDFVELSGATYSLPLEKTVTTNAQGHYCFSGAVSGKTYVPVHLDPNWKTTAATPAPTPASGTTPAPTPSPTPAATPAATPGGATPAPTPSSGVTTPTVTTVVGKADTVSETTSMGIDAAGSAKTLVVDPGSGSVTTTVKAATAGQEQQVELAVSGATVNIPLSAMGSSQQVSLSSVSATAAIAASPAPSGATVASEALSMVLTPALEVAIGFVVNGLVSGRRQATVYRVHWLDKKSNAWNALCTEHTTDTATKTVTATIPKWVQEEDGFNPSSGCATGVTSCDGKGGTLLVFALDAEPDCSSGLGAGVIAGIVVGSLAGVGLIAGGAFMAYRASSMSEPPAHLRYADANAFPEGIRPNATSELAFSATPSVMYSPAGTETKV